MLDVSETGFECIRIGLGPRDGNHCVDGVAVLLLLEEHVEYDWNLGMCRSWPPRPHH